MFFALQLNAQYYFFGRNKVRYEKFDWKVIKTKHFDIYYYGRFRQMAQIGAKYAEEAYEDHKIKFNFVVNTRIPLIFYNTHIQFQQTNTTPGFIPEGVGGFFEFIKGRVVIPYLGSLKQFRHVIRHELVHVFMTSKIMNVLTDHRIPTDRFPPLWFTEGLAEFWSTDWDTQADMVMRDAVINHEFVPLARMDRIYGTFQMYKEGQNFLMFVSETYGKEKILELMENIWRFPKFVDNLEYTLGESLEKIDERWDYYLKKKYFPLIKKEKTHAVSSVAVVNQGFNYSPAVYKDTNGVSIIYVGNHIGYSSVFQTTLNSEAPDSNVTRILVEGEREKTYEAFHLLEPSLDVSKNGLVVFVTKSGRSDVLHFYSLKLKREIKEFRRKDLISISSPKFSRDGKSIVFNAIDDKGFSDIYILRLKSFRLKRLTNDYYLDKEPVFGEEGKVIFVSDRTGGIFKGKENLFEIDTTTYRINYLTYVNANVDYPGFSPDGQRLYFTCDLDGAANLYELKLKDGLPYGMIKSTNFLTGLFGFSFLNDSTIVYAGFENFSFKLYEHTLKSNDGKTVKFHFEKSFGIWKPEEIALKSKKEILRYKRKYSIDYAFSQVVTDPVYGTRGGAVMELSDLLSDDKYYFLLYNTAEVQSEILKSFNVAITRINSSSRTNYGYGIFNYSGRRYDIRESNEFFYERIFGGVFSLIYPFSVFNRLEASVSLANSDREIYENLSNRKALLLSNSLTFVHDNSLWGPTGPLDGSRFRLLLGYTTDIKYSNVNYFSFIADFRKYFRTSLRTAIATRASIFINQGKEAKRYIAGGSWDLRGWPRWGIRGEKLWLSSVEFRFPLIDKFVVKFPFIGIEFNGIRGAAFFDAGGAWDTKYRQTLGSIGVGVRINLFNVIAFRYDIGKKIENNFSNLQPRLFYQFFFGWDF